MFTPFLSLQVYAKDASGGWSAPRPLPAQFKPAPCCPSCRAPIHCVSRYGRAVNHAAAQRADQKFLVAGRRQLDAADAALMARRPSGGGGGGSGGGGGGPSGDDDDDDLPDDSALRDALRAYDVVARAAEAPPTVRLHRACVAASARSGAEHPLEVAPPDATILCRALLGKGRALSLRMCALASQLWRTPPKPTVPHLPRLRPAAHAAGDAAAARADASAPPRDPLGPMREAAGEATRAMERSASLARERGLHASLLRASAELSAHRSRYVAARLRVRGAPPSKGGGPLSPPEREALLALLSTAEGDARAALAGSGGVAPTAEVAAAASDALQRAGDLAKAVVRDEPLSADEARMIFASMFNEAGGRGYTGHGHWFQCANGHPYVVGECGGAMEAGRCPECGAAVGGTQHNIGERAAAFLGLAGQ